MFDLKKFRKKFKLTQTDVAFILGCGQSNIAAIEKNGKSLNDEQIKTLESKYGDISDYISDDNINQLSIDDNQINWVELTNKQQAIIERILDLLEKEKMENLKLSQSLTEITKKVIEKIAI